MIFSSIGSLKAQGWTYRTECLTMIATADGLSKPDSCKVVSWYVSGATFTGSTLTYKFSKPGTYQVCMKMKNTCLKWDTTVCKSVKVDTCNNVCQKLLPDFTWSSSCRTIKLSAKSGVTSGTTSYSWYYGNGATGTGANNSYTFVKDGTYKVCLLATWTDPITGTVCKKEVCKEIKISCTDPCNIKGELTITYGTGGQIKFSASSKTGYYYTWKYGDGTTGTGSSTSKWYKKSGTYDVCVRICDKTQKCCTTICKKVIIEEPCRLQGGFSYKSIGSGSFKFYGYSTDKGASYSWNFGDGTTGSGMDPQKSFTRSGTYTICVTITSSDKRCKITSCKKVVVTVPEKRCSWAKAGFGLTSTNTCAIVKTEANNMADSCISYQWTVNGVAVDSVGGRLKTITLPKNGTYSICLKLTNLCKKCDTVICKSVTVSCYQETCKWAANGAGFAATIKCPNLVLEGYNLNNGCLKYAFTISNSSGVPLATFNGRTQSIGFSSNGDYYVCMKLTDTCKKCDTTICKKITVNCSQPCNWKKAGAGFYANVNCKKVTLTANAINNSCVKYNWYSGGAFIGSGQNITTTYVNNGTYNICLKLADTCKKCDTSICQNVNINCNPCSATAKFRVDSISKKGIVFVTNLSTGGYSYMWDWADSTFSKIKSPVYHAYKYGGSKKICLTVWDSAGKCSTSFCITVQFVITRGNTASTIAPEQTTIVVHPNPANQTTRVTWNGTYTDLCIYNATGAMVYQAKLSGNSTELEVAELPAGIYTIKANGPAGFAFQKLIIQRN